MPFYNRKQINFYNSQTEFIQNHCLSVNLKERPVTRKYYTIVHFFSQFSLTFDASCKTYASQYFPKLDIFDFSDNTHTI